MSARQRSRRRLMLRALVLLGGVSLLSPLYLMLVFATHTDAEIMSMPAPLWFGSHLGDNLRELFARLPHFATNLWMSLRAASATALLQVVLCSIAGYAFAMMRFRGKDALFALVLATLLLPGSLGMIPRLLLIEKLGWYDSVRGLAIPSAASALGIFLLRQYISTAVPRDVVEAARLDGCSTQGVYWRIVLPIARPALAALALLAFIGSWNDHLAQLTTLHEMPVYTAPLALNSLVGTGHVPLGPIFAGAALSTLPVLLVYALLAKKLFLSLSIDSNAGG